MYAHVYGYMKCSGILKRGNFLSFITASIECQNYIQLHVVVADSDF